MPAVKHFLFLIFFLLSTTCLWAKDTPHQPLSAAEVAKRQEKVWQQAQDFLKQGDTGQAALYFGHYAKTYPDQPRAKQALWQAATLFSLEANNASAPDFATAQDLYQRFILAFPSAQEIPAAYLGLANNYFSMAYFREANNYYTLFLKKYSGHPQADMARWQRARSRIRIHKLQQAREDYALLSLSHDPIFALRGQAGLGHIYFAKGEWHNSLGILLRILHHNPDYYIYDPEILEALGIASLRVGNIKEGRRYLLHYINIANQAKIEPAILFELAESFMAQGKTKLAIPFYHRLLKQNSAQHKLVILSRFRLAQVKASQLDAMSKTKRASFIAQKGDHIFQTVLDDLYTDPLAQEARLALFHRYLDRQEYDAAYGMGKAYLRYKTQESAAKEIKNWLGKLLLKKIEPLLAAKKYQQIRTIYEQEYKSIATYPRGSLLIIIGTAFAADGLYDQASIIYYRAMALAMTPAEKDDLYRKRAKTYLANNDLRAAQRLLKFLRQVYQGKPLLCEINWLSGQLREAQQRPENALTFYKMAVEAGEKSSNRRRYAQDYLRLLLATSPPDSARQLAWFKKKQWLSPQDIQQWYSQIGDTLLLANNKAAALSAYRQALAADLPEESAVAQASHLHLGDLLAIQGNKSEALAHFRKAARGPVATITNQAKIRLTQGEITADLKKVKGILNN